MNWNREVSKNLEHTKVGIKDWRDTAERRHVLKQARRWARWQRDQLRTNEAIERVARGIARMEPDEDWDNGHELDLEYKQECFETAIDAITALLGEH